MLAMIDSPRKARPRSRSALLAIAVLVLIVWYAFGRQGGASPDTDPAPAPSPATSLAEATQSAPRWDPATFRKPDDEQLRKRLTKMQYDVTQHEATEPPFHNPYWDNHRPGIYVDVVSGEPLFSSYDKFESGTGWPSFTKPLEPSNVKTHTDYKLILPRSEVRSAHADSHLGHVFDDGPPPTGQRYCMNSASLRFVPVDRLQAEGYGQYLVLFESAGGARPATGESPTASGNEPR